MWHVAKRNANSIMLNIAQHSLLLQVENDLQLEEHMEEQLAAAALAAQGYC